MLDGRKMCAIMDISKKRGDFMRYYVEKTTVVDPSLDSREWERAEVGAVDKNPWKREGLFPAPKTEFQLLRGPEGLSVRMHSAETQLRMEEAENGGVCRDSCMEFFYKPSPWDTRYLNFEINPKGVMHLGIGDGRFDRVLLWEREKLSIQAQADENGWTVKFYIPDSWLAECYPKLAELSRGNTSPVARANFYKCGELTAQPHLAAWSPIAAKGSDFHVPDFFGTLVLE